MAAVAGTMPMALWVEARKLVKANLIAGVLPAEDATTLAAVVATLEEAKGLLA